MTDVTAAKFESKSGSFAEVGRDVDTPPGYTKVTEGYATILFPPTTTQATRSQQPSEEDGGDDALCVFYNPAQVVNRDLSVCALQVFSRLRESEPKRKGGTTEGITILEALSASGLRAIRYWNEIQGLRYVIANDLDADAVRCIRENCALNHVPTASSTLTENLPEAAVKAGGAVIPNHDDAIVLMQRLALDPNHIPGGGRLALHLPPPASSGGSSPTEEVRALLQTEKMDVVDLDPYGTASPFLDSAFSCIKEGGLMLVTSTDSPILCGNYPDTCHAKYNSIMPKASYCHESAVRILLAAAERVANKHKKFIVPLISLHIDFYVRVFFRVYTQPAEVKLAPTKLGYVAQCTRCPCFWTTPMARTKPTRKEQRKRQRAAGDDAVPNQGQENGSTLTPTAAAASSLGDSSYPPIPNMREGPYKTQCPTVESWLGDLVAQVPGTTRTLGCPVCHGRVVLGGALYLGPIHNHEFLQLLLSEIDQREEAGTITAAPRIRGLVRAAMDEIPHAPLFYSLPDIASTARVHCPPTPEFVSALARLGYPCSQVNCCKYGLKTTCPGPVLFRLMLAYKATQQQQQEGEPSTAATDAVVVENVKVEETLSAAAVSNSVVDKAAGNPNYGKKKANRKKDAGDAAAQNDDSAESLAGPVVLHVTPLEGADFTYDRQYDFRSAVTGVAKFIPNAPGWGPKKRHEGIHNAE